MTANSNQALFDMELRGPDLDAGDLPYSCLIPICLSIDHLDFISVDGVAIDSGMSRHQGYVLMVLSYTRLFHAVSTT